MKNSKKFMNTNNKSKLKNPYAITNAHAMEPGSSCVMTLGDAKITCKRV